MKEGTVRCAVIGVALGMLLAIPAAAGYDVRVNTVADFLRDINVVAVVPATCPARANCLAAEADLMQELQRYTKFAVIPPDRVRQAMLEAEINQIDDNSRPALADKLHADAFLLPVITDSGTESEGAVGVWSGYVMTMVDSQVSRGGVQVALIAAKSGKVLMQGAGFGESEWRGKKGVLRKIFRSIMTKAFRPPQ